MDDRAPEGFILGIQEPVWNSHTKTIPHLRGHYTFVDRGAKPRPRAAIYASNNLNLWAVPEYTSKDMATALWVVENEIVNKIYVVSLYSPDMSNEPAETREPIVNKKLTSLTKRCSSE